MPLAVPHGKMLPGFSWIGWAPLRNCNLHSHTGDLDSGGLWNHTASSRQSRVSETLINCCLEGFSCCKINRNSKKKQLSLVPGKSYPCKQLPIHWGLWSARWRAARWVSEYFVYWVIKHGGCLGNIFLSFVGNSLLFGEMASSLMTLP